MATSVATGALLCQLATSSGSSSSRCRQQSADQPAEQPTEQHQTVQAVCRRSQWHSRHISSSTARQQQLTHQWQQQLAAGTGSITGSSCRSLNSDSHINSSSISSTGSSCTSSDSSSGNAHGKWVLLGRGRSSCTNHDAQQGADSNHSAHSGDVNPRGSSVGPSSPSTSDSTQEAESPHNLTRVMSPTAPESALHYSQLQARPQAVTSMTLAEAGPATGRNTACCSSYRHPSCLECSCSGSFSPLCSTLVPSSLLSEVGPSQKAPATSSGQPALLAPGPPYGRPRVKRVRMFRRAPATSTPLGPAPPPARGVTPERGMREHGLVCRGAFGRDWSFGSPAVSRRFAADSWTNATAA